MKRERPRALLVDDAALPALQLTRQLDTLGFAVVCAPDLAAALPQAAEASVILVELLLWRDNGFRVLRALRTRCYCPLLLLSGTGRDTDLQWGLRAGAGAVLTRPFDSARLRQALLAVGCTPLS